jgi:hypothetical protein
VSAEALIEPIARANALDRVADPVRRALERMPEPARSVLAGEWLGHPLHPMLTDLPIGFWTSAWVLDIARRPGTEAAADALLGLGVVSAVPTVAAGWTDWRSLGRSDRRVGVVHAASNAVATGLFAWSWVARRRGNRSLGVALCHAGAATATVGGFLGGHLAFAASGGEAAPTGDPGSEADENRQVAGAPSDNTSLVVILRGLRGEGFGADFRPVGADGDVRCGACGTTSPAGSFGERSERRLEGASDPADMMLVVAGTCPACAARGVMTLSYGPEAGEADAAVVACLA